MPGALQNEHPQKDEARTPKGYPSLVFLLKIKNVDRNHKQNQYLLFERYGERVFALNSEMIIPQNTPKGTINGLLLKWINTRDSNSYEYIRALYCASVGLFAGSGMVKIENSIILLIVPTINGTWNKVRRTIRPSEPRKSFFNNMRDCPIHMGQSLRVLT